MNRFEISYIGVGSDSEKNAVIEKKINEALELALAKLNLGCEPDSDSDNVAELIEFLLRFIGLLVPALTTVLGSTVGGLLGSLSGNGLIGGLLGTVGKTLHGLNAGSLKGLIVYLKGVLP